MQEHEIIQRIKDLCKARSWTLYRLAKESRIPYSTLCTMLHKENSPSVPTLIKLCDGFGITLSAFFDCGHTPPCHTPLPESWQQLTPENQASAEQYMQFLLSQQQN